MSVRGVGTGTPPPAAQQQAADAQQKEQGQQQELKARNAAGKQAHSSPKSEYQRPHRVHTSQERRAAEARHHEAALLQEASQHLVIDKENFQIQAIEEAPEDQRLKGISLDEKRNKRGKNKQDEESKEKDNAEEAAVALGLSEGGAGKYFKDMPVDRMGDPTLVNPNEMKRLLGPSVRFAQHAMLLAEARRKEGATREESLAYLASLYLGLADRAYANKALREFGAATGIVELYPLELMKHLMEHVPSFMSRVSTAAFLSAVPTEGYKGKAGVPIKLSFEPSLRIRGFAVKGGDKPGYVLEPIDPPGNYHLTFGTPGTFVVMISALEKAGTLHIQELSVEVAPGDAAALERSAAFQRERSSEAEGTPSEPPPPGDNTTPPMGTKIPGASTDPAAKKKDLSFTLPRKI